MLCECEMMSSLPSVPKLEDPQGRPGGYDVNEAEAVQQARLLFIWLIERGECRRSFLIAEKISDNWERNRKSCNISKER